jgi:hypothetical protein
MNESGASDGLISIATMDSVQYKGINAARRKELTQLAEQCIALFDTYKVLQNERCFVGRLCQVLGEFQL